MINLLLITFFFGIYCLLMVRSHVLLCLISLELIIIYMLLIFYYFCSFMFCSMYLFIMFMTFLVCEGALGLSLMVHFIRFHSNDYLNSMMMW